MTDRERRPRASRGVDPRAREDGVNQESVDFLVADRLRRARQLKRLTLAEVASHVGLSHNFLSMVERGVTDLSLSRFRRLAAFYGIPAGELLDEPNNQLEPRISSPDDGVLIDRGDGIANTLFPNQEFGVQVVVVKFAPGARSQELLTHEGADIAFVTRGKLVLRYGDREYPLKARQCVSYKATVPHSWANPSKAEAEVVGVIVPPYW
jgi:transcriptional regulator with XRE-family HTH domain